MVLETGGLFAQRVQNRPENGESTRRPEDPC